MPPRHEKSAIQEQQQLGAAAVIAMVLEVADPTAAVAPQLWCKVAALVVVCTPQQESFEIH